MRKTIITLGTAIALAAGTTGAMAATADAAPPAIETHHFYDCEGPAGTPEQFDASVPVGRARFVVDSTTVWRVWRVVDANTGEISLYDMPEEMLDHTKLPLVTCSFRALHFDLDLIATGTLMPAPQSDG
jgi:hypothetical protein